MKRSPIPRSLTPYSISTLGKLAAALAVALAGPWSAQATEWFVNASAAAGGTGTSAAPFQTITQGINAAAAGDIVTVSSGTYREAVSIPSTKGGPNTTTPFTVRTASGAAVVVSGATAVPAASWTVYGGTTIAPAGETFTATAAFKARDLYNGFNRNVLARIPDVSKPRAVISGWDYTTGTITLSAPLGVTFPSVMSMFADVFNAGAQAYGDFPVASVSNNGQTIVLSGTFTSSTAIAVNDTLLLCNHPQLIKNWQEWAYDAVSPTQTNLYFDAINSSNVRNLQCRTVADVVTVSSASNVLLQGLEVFGGVTYGVYVNHGTNVTVDHCIMHEHGLHVSGPGADTNGGEGVFISYGTNVVVQNSVISANDHGLAVAAGNGVTINKCHVCYNDADGFDITGRDYTQGQTLDSNALYNVTISNCYVHNQLCLEHPDDLQVYSGVSGFTLTHSFFGLGGQNMMTQDMHSTTATDCIFWGSGARNIILGHGYDTNITYTNCTIGLAQYAGAPGMDSSDVPNASTDDNVTSQNNIIYLTAEEYCDNNSTRYGPFDLHFNYNLYWNNTDPIGQTWPYKTFTTPAQVTASTNNPAAGQEANSTLGNPMFTNAPLRQATVNDVQSATTTSLPLTFAQFNTAAGFAVNGTVEVNGDGVARTITARTGNTITISPALATRPFRTALVWDWGTNTNVALDLRPAAGSPALTGSSTGGARGSDINLIQFQQGDYDGDGVRDIPADSTNWTTPMTTPYQKYPYFGIP